MTDVEKFVDSIVDILFSKIEVKITTIVIPYNLYDYDNKKGTIVHLVKHPLRKIPKHAGHHKSRLGSVMISVDKLSEVFA